MSSRSASFRVGFRLRSAAPHFAQHNKAGFSGDFLIAVFPLPSVGRTGDFVDAHAVVGGVAAGIAADGHLVAGSERVLFNALPAELTGSTRFRFPEDRLSVAGRRLQQDGGVRAAVKKFDDLAFEGDGLVGVGGGKGVVCGDATDAENGEQENREKRECNTSLHRTIIPYGCLNRSFSG
jgi:hypothetical protein